MIDKTITLTEPHPSDFKPTLSIREIHKHFDAFGFYDARMIGGSKSFYRKEHLDDLIVFNANVLMPGFGKVWYGDLNVTEDYLALRQIAETLNTDLYVLMEMDARFDEETKPLNELLDKAVWNTTEDEPTLEWYKKKNNLVIG